MVHDLTANSDFQGDRNFNFLGRFARELERVSDNLTPPYDEVVLTGTTFDRDHKRYVLDYESNKKNIRSVVSVWLVPVCKRNYCRGKSCE